MRSSLLLSVLAAASTALAASAGCGKATTLSSGTKSITVNGKNRQYILQLPNNYKADTPYKLIIGFHWLNGNMNNVAPGFYGLRDLAKDTAIFLAPNGLNSGWGNSGGEDVTFADQLIALAKSSACIDEDNIFATGFSYGGAMSYAMACARPDVIKAVAVIAGAQLSGCAGGTKPVAYLGIHGVSDSVLNISQGRALRDKFLQLNQCASKNAPEPARGAGQQIKTTYSCNPRYPVWWIAHGGDHVGDPRSGNNYWAATESWDFFTKTIVTTSNSTTSAAPATTTRASRVRRGADTY